MGEYVSNQQGSPSEVYGDISADRKIFQCFDSLENLEKEQQDYFRSLLNKSCSTKTLSKNVLRLSENAEDYQDSLKFCFSEFIEQLFQEEKNRCFLENQTVLKRIDFARMCGVNADTEIKWRKGLSLPKEENLKYMGLSFRFTLEQVNFLLRCFGYRELYSFDPYDYIYMYVIKNCRDHKNLLDTHKNCLLHLPLGFFPNLMWQEQIHWILNYAKEKDAEHFTEEHFAAQCIRINSKLDTPNPSASLKILNQWKKEENNLPGKKHLIDMAIYLEFYLEDVELLLEMCHLNPLRESEKIRLRSNGILSHPEGIYGSLFFPAAQQYFPYKYGSSTEQAQFFRNRPHTLTFGQKSTSAKDVDSLIREFKANYVIPHRRVLEFLECYLRVWAETLPPEAAPAKWDYESLRQYFTGTYFENFRDQSHIIHLFTRLEEHGELPSREIMIIIGILLELTSDELNLFLNCCHYLPLNAMDSCDFLVKCILDCFYERSSGKCLSQKKELACESCDKSALERHHSSCLKHCSAFLNRPSADTTSIWQKYKNTEAAAAIPTPRSNRETPYAMALEIFHQLYPVTTARELKNLPPLAQLIINTI